MYHCSIEEFLDVSIDEICRTLENNILDVSNSEKRSWQNSYKFLKDEIRKSKIPIDTNIIFEAQVPNANERIDVILTGYDKNKSENILVIEMKQWSDENVDIPNSSKMSFVKVKMAKEQIEKMLHPAIQANNYKLKLQNYNKELRNLSINPLVYLHNYSSDNIKSHKRFEIDPSTKIFTKNDSLSNYLSEQLIYGDDIILHKILNGEILPNPKLAESINDVLRQDSTFVLDEKQMEVFSKAKAFYNHSQSRGFLIEGGPGTGKSVIAIKLLAHFLSEGLNAVYVTKNASPRTVYKNLLERAVGVHGNQIFVSPSARSHDVVIVDEAHRLTRNQLDSLIKNNKFIVIFIDEKQIVHSTDIGYKSEVYQAFKRQGVSLNQNHEVNLYNQYRCLSSEGYIDRINSLLYESENYTRNGMNGYDVKIFDDIALFYEQLSEKYSRYPTTRMVAGYCWEWASRKNSSKVDISIGEFNKKWNLSDYPNGGSSSWIIQESFDEVGCIHTCQGLEVDYVGVIIGDDLIYRNGRIITNVSARAKDDFSLSKDLSPDKANLIILNTYRVLLTRGMKGCYIYCTDKALREYLKEVFI